MSDGAPCERGIGAAGTMPLRDMEVPGLIPGVGEVKLDLKEARQGRQHSRQQQRQEEKASCRGRSLVDRDRCLGVIAEAVDGHRRELKVISQGLNLCKGTLCSDVVEVRAWVTGALEEQQGTMLRMMGKVVKLRKAIEGPGRARSAKGKIVTGGELSGRRSVHKAGAPTMKESSKGEAQGTPASLTEAPCVQAEVCDGGCDSAAGAVSGTPDQPQLSTTPDVHVQGGQGVPLMLAATTGRVAKAADAKVVDGASVHTDGVSTVSTVQWESRADVDDRAGSEGDGKVHGGCWSGSSCNLGGDWEQGLQGIFGGGSGGV